ncbi:MAG TPA: hypothetical protein VL134_02945 [Leptolyngbya sp.]|nr:hypothetical protein [Leptolyngbya sp.]
MSLPLIVSPSPIAFRPKQEIEVFEQPEALLPVLPFANELQLTVGELFAWLLE